MTFTDDKKASCTLFWQIFLPKLSSSVYCQNSSSSTPKEKFVQNADKPLGFPLLLWDCCWEGWGILNFIFADDIVRKVESFCHFSSSFENFSTTLLIFYNLVTGLLPKEVNLSSELFSSGLG